MKEARLSWCCGALGFWRGVVMTFTLGAGTAAAAPVCEPVPGAGPMRPVVNLRVDNDLFGGLGQDRGYTSGFQLTLMSPNLRGYQDPDCLPAIARNLNRFLEWLQPVGFDQLNMVMGIGHAMYTPTDRDVVELQVNDRPYAAALLFGVGYNARYGDKLHVSQLRVGIVGPSARGRHLQNGWHGIIGADPFLGWSNQLRDEPVLQLVHERMRRWAPPSTQDGWSWDLIGHWGVSVGNLRTYANVGAEWRYGLHLPDDFGSTPLRPAGENSAPMRGGWGSAGWAGHLFVTADVRAVAHDLTLDGNTFKRSHSVDKRPLVADVGYGLVLTHGEWKFAFARYHRSREFVGQQEVPVFGSITVSRTF